MFKFQRGGRPRSGESVIAGAAIIKAYRYLADGVGPTKEADGSLIHKVGIEDLRNELKNTGYLETTGKGGLTPNARKVWQRTKGELLGRGRLVERDGFIWEMLKK